jgi:hypothetical protein
LDNWAGGGFDLTWGGVSPSGKGDVGRRRRKRRWKRSARREEYCCCICSSSQVAGSGSVAFIVIDVVKSQAKALRLCFHDVYFFTGKGGPAPSTSVLSRGFWDKVSVMSQPGQQHGLPGLPVPGTNW